MRSENYIRQKFLVCHISCDFFGLMFQIQLKLFRQNFLKIKPNHDRCQILQHWSGWICRSQHFTVSRHKRLVIIHSTLEHCNSAVMESHDLEPMFYVIRNLWATWSKTFCLHIFVNSVEPHPQTFYNSYIVKILLWKVKTHWLVR